MKWSIVLLSVAAAEEVHLEPGDGTSIQAAINDANPGDIITLGSGTYEEDLSTESAGTADAPITLRAAEDASVTITSAGEVFQIEHAHWVIEGITFDGQFGNDDTIEIRGGANHTQLNNVEVKNSGRDCIDMDNPTGVRISDSRIHHCLYFDVDNGEREEAHGITGGAVQDLRIDNTDIHTFSGDGIQFDPKRLAPGWNNIHIEGCRFWLEPLMEDTAGFSAGDIPGENAIETATWNDAPEATLTIVDTEAWGFKDGMGLSNQAAFRFKEHVNVTLERVHVRESEIAFRIHGPTSASPIGAMVHIENTLLHDVGIGVRYEDAPVNVSMAHMTFGYGIESIFEAVDSETTSFDIENSLFWSDELPNQVDESQSNQLATNDDFIDASDGDHHLAAHSTAIDAGEVVSGIDIDLDGNERIVGMAPDLGAYEYQDVITPDTGEADTGVEEESDPDEHAGSSETDDTAEIDSEEETVGGIGAAEQVGEKGGCGCHSPIPRRTGGFWVLLSALVILRRSRKTAISTTSS